MSRFIKAITNRAVIIMLVISIILLVVSFSNTLVSFKDAITFEDILEDTKIEEGDYVKGELLYSFGSFASENTSTTKNGKVVSTEKNTTVYFVIPGYEEDLYYGLAVGKDLTKDVEKNADETYKFMEGSAAPTTCPEIEGRVKVMEGELLKYWKDWLKEAGYTSKEIDAMDEFYYIDKLDSTSSRLMTFGGLILFIVAIIVIILIMSKEKRKEDMASNAAMVQMHNDTFGNEPYVGQNASVPQGYVDPYAQQNAYADPYAQQNGYAQQNAYADPYAQQNGYAQQNAYADPYAQQNAYVDPYAQQNGYAQQNTYADPFAAQNNQSNNNMQ